MSNVTPIHPDRIGELKGPKRIGHAVLVDGRHVPNMHMHDRGDVIEFVLDGRLAFEFPRDIAAHAAAFAAQAMAIGAGHPSLSAPHKASLPYGTEVFEIGS